MNIELIRKIVKASGVKEGELILIHFWGEDSRTDIMHKFAAAVAGLGASPLELQQSRSNNKAIFEAAGETCFDSKYYSIFDKVDAVLDVFVYRPVVLNDKLAEEQMKLYRNYMGKLFGVLAQKSRFTQIRIPTVENAQESGLEPEEYIERMTKAYDIDYTKLRALCESRIEELRTAKQIILRSGNDCRLTLVTADREWIADCGDGDWPCGEVYTAPQEYETNGKLFYDKLYIEDVGAFDHVILTVKDGLLIESDNNTVRDFIAGLPKENRVVCELGFGYNDNISSLCGYTVLDEKMRNTFHIAIGDNTMFGGTNKADFHMDFVGTADAEIIH
jgi:leucyl aminopeptidase (aminopeptidase T)